MNNTERRTSPISLRSVLGNRRLHYLAGEAAAKALAFAALVLIARVLGPSEYGRVSIYTATATLLSLVIAAGVPNAVLRFHFSSTPFAAVLGTAATIMAVSFLAIGGLVAIAMIWIAPLLSVPVGLLWFAIAGGMAIALRNAWLSSLRARHRSGAHAFSQLAEAALFTAAAAVLLVVPAPTADSRFVIASYTGATALVALAGIFRWSRDPGLRFDRGLVLPLLRFAAPMIVHGFGMAGLATADQLIVSQLAGPAATGVYSLAYRFGMSMMILSTAFSSAWVPEFLEMAAVPDQAAIVHARTDRYVAGMIGCAIALMVVMPPLARLAGGAVYAAAPPLIPVVIYAYLWFVPYTLVFAHALHEGRPARIAAATLAALIVNLALNYLLVPRAGLMGAAVASVAGYAALFALQWATHRRVLASVPLARWTAWILLTGIAAAALSSVYGN